MSEQSKTVAYAKGTGIVASGGLLGMGVLGFMQEVGYAPNDMLQAFIIGIAGAVTPPLTKLVAALYRRLLRAVEGE